jgi:type I restriction enzyme M protein
MQNLIEQKLKNQKNRVVSLTLSNKNIEYHEKIKSNIKIISGDEEVSRAFLIDRLVNELDYSVELIELEKSYDMKVGRDKKKPRIDVVVKDTKGNPFFFIEVKAPSKYEHDKVNIEGQLFTLAQEEVKKFGTKVSYLVYYTTEEISNQIVDKLIMIDFKKYPTFDAWEEAGSISVGNELTAGYGEPQKQPFIMGHEKYDLKVQVKKEEIELLAKDLHNKLWGGGGTNDSEIFYSLVNIILAKVQDESERVDGEEYHFQLYQYGNNPENLEKLFTRVNELYRRALREKLNITDSSKVEKAYVINEEKFPLTKLAYCVTSLEKISFFEARNTLDGKDILGDFFESITRDGFKQTKGQFFTPTNIVNFINYAIGLDTLAIDKLNKDRELPYIIDPSAGSATYIVEAMKVITKELKYKQFHKLKMNRQTKEKFRGLFPEHKENQWAETYLYGSDINFDLGIASKVNMILHGDGSSNIFVKDGLLPFRFYTKDSAPNHLSNAEEDETYNNKDINGSFDVIISNPPFSVDLDTQTKRLLPQSFLFADKKNSENLFIERYYQLLRENGRVGVVLPESVFDTTENKYIRLFLFKYFKIKAVVSLPQITFEPFTSTKTSILFLQKKTKKEIKEWNRVWDKYGKEWATLKTRCENLIKVYLEEKDREKLPSIKNMKKSEEQKVLVRFLKDYIIEDDKIVSSKKICSRYQDEIKELCKHDKDTTDVFGFYNTWWVFGEVAKEFDYDIFMAEAENVGYKRSKRGEKIMPNDLFDLEYAPNSLSLNDVENYYDNKITSLTKELSFLIDEQKKVDKKLEEKETSTLLRKSELLIEHIEDVEESLETSKFEKDEALSVYETYYENDKIRTEHFDRTDEELIRYFNKGIMRRWASSDILLRVEEERTILDTIRKSVKWD